MAALRYFVIVFVVAADGQYIQCINSDSCSGTTIDCPTNAFCVVQCNHYLNACKDAIINCPTNHRCEIQCNGSDNPCDGATINCGNGECMIRCEGPESACLGATINGATSNNFEITCGSGNNQDVSRSLTIYCPAGDDCNIPCDTTDACTDAIIHGAVSRAMSVTCAGEEACERILINGASSSQLVINDCGSEGNYQPCGGITVYCPPNVNGSKVCTIHGDDGLFGNSINPLSFYAINGFADINFIVNGKTTNYMGTMYCSAGYQDSCAIASTSFECDVSDNLICNGDITTAIPTVAPTTISPSQSPTYAPITSILTTTNPSSNPSDYPTDEPSTKPSDSPTLNPSKYPSTSSPSNPPSISSTLNPATPSPNLRINAEPTISAEGGLEESSTTEAMKVTYTNNNESALAYTILWSVILITTLLLLLCTCLCIFTYCKITKAKSKKVSFGTDTPGGIQVDVFSIFCDTYCVVYMLTNTAYTENSAANSKLKRKMGIYWNMQKIKDNAGIYQHKVDYLYHQTVTP